ncbi:YegP family protein [Rhodococcus jostii]|uniref:YegP family protein n=1 Tax=Rhodococcus jostii TaxID=132919 RepID=UPI003659D89A
MTAKFELFKDTAGQFRFHLKAANGEIIAASQGYTTKAAAQNGITSIKANAGAAPIEDLT